MGILFPLGNLALRPEAEKAIRRLLVDSGIYTALVTRDPGSGMPPEGGFYVTAFPKRGSVNVIRYVVSNDGAVRFASCGSK